MQQQQDKTKKKQFHSELMAGKKNFSQNEIFIRKFLRTSPVTNLKQTAIQRH